MCQECGTSFEHEFQWFCFQCNIGKDTLPCLSDLDASELENLTLNISAWNNAHACCGRLPEDCTCIVPISRETASELVGENAYSAVASCVDCVHYASLSCKEYRLYLREYLSGTNQFDVPELIDGCKDFLCSLDLTSLEEEDNLS